MAAVDPLFAQWLQAEADFVVRSDDDAAARWGASGVTTERVTGVATRAGAEAEGDRQLGFLRRGPFAVDTHRLVGADWAAALGRVVRLSGEPGADPLGYGFGVDVFVLGVDVDRAAGLSQVTVLRPLKGAS